MIYATEQTFDQAKEKLSAEDKGEFESTLAEARKALESEDLATMEGALEGLTTLSHKMAEKMYEQAGDSGAGDPAGGQAPPAAEEDEVIDAEYVDVDEKS
jgi:molecular chaperone DnaK